VGATDSEENDMLCICASLAVTDRVTDEKEDIDVGCDEASALGMAPVCARLMGA
jgi:hypothetical protein